MSFTQQTARDLARLKTETETADKRARDRLSSLDTRCTNLEAFEAYVRDDLYPWLVLLEAFVGFGTPPPEPPP